MSEFDDIIATDPIRLQAQFLDPDWGFQQLRKITIFEEVTDDELKELYQQGEVQKVNSKSHVIIEGENSRGMYILLFGTVSVLKFNPSANTNVRLSFLEKGATFGELSLFEEAPRSATVAAETECYLFFLDEKIFSQFLDERGDNVKVRFYRRCATEMAERFRVQNHDYISAQQQLWSVAFRLKKEKT